MTKQQAKSILKGLKLWRKRDDEIQKAYDKFIEVIASGSYSPIVEDTCVQAFIDGACGDNKELSDWLSYYVYEVPDLEGEAMVQVYGKENDAQYDFKKDKDVIEFLITL